MCKPSSQGACVGWHMLSKLNLTQRLLLHEGLERPYDPAGTAGEAARARLQAPLLLQSAQAFKAAQPGAQQSAFQSFLRQHKETLGLDAHTIDSLPVCAPALMTKLQSHAGREEHHFHSLWVSVFDYHLPQRLSLIGRPL